MAVSIAARFHNAHVIPPKGGWHYVLDGHRFDAYSEDDLVQEIRKYQRNNGVYKGEDAIVEALWRYLCRQEPNRCGDKQYMPSAEERAMPGAPRDLKPEVMGPWIWRFLNLAAVRWEPASHEFFLSVCDQIVVLLECPICREEWRRILATTPPTYISSRKQACEWVLGVHNSVNQRLGKTLFTYSQMVSEYGAPL